MRPFAVITEAACYKAPYKCPVYLLTYLLSFISRPDVVKRPLNLALVFLCSFCVVVHFFSLANYVDFVVSSLVFSTPSPRVGSGAL